MPPATVATTTDLVRLLRDYSLLEPAQLDEVADDLRPHVREPRELARELIRLNWLTPFQADQLFQGRGGELLLGSYLLLQRLGEGGMAQVFKARNRKTGAVVAVKLLRRERLA